jgi:metal-sulfur cluster biosynthetic enzyme
MSEQTGPSATSRAQSARPSTPSAEEIREAVKVVEDPEIGISIVELGLVYGIENVDGDVSVTMTLTSPFCPIGPFLISQIQTVIEELPGIKSCNVELVWSPPWDPKAMASDEAKDMLGIW